MILDDGIIRWIALLIIVVIFVITLVIDRKIDAYIYRNKRDKGELSDEPSNSGDRDVS